MSQVERLQQVRRELDEAASQVDRLARALAKDRLQLMGQAEIGEAVGEKSSTVGVWVTRGQLPEPVAQLACGRVWLKADIDAWIKTRKRTRR